jgi:pantoate--beta-alanine ligase
MEIIKRVKEMQRSASDAKRRGLDIGLVPTMGYLHEGHLSLIRIARKRCDLLVVSIFVNPAQFGAGEDLDAYPRDLHRDEELCNAEGVDIIFYPKKVDMYPEGFTTGVLVKQLSELLCGKSRPEHFEGVTTVVAKLFNIVMPDIAVFGKKDYQQQVIIRRMTADLNFPIEIITGETIRETDGLALSSRNKYLTPSERDFAPALRNALIFAKKRIESGEAMDSKKLTAEMAGMIESDGTFEIDYIEIFDPENLTPIDNPSGKKSVIALAARIGKTRLIDNIEVGF